jgi:hypothetical protein
MVLAVEVVVATCLEVSQEMVAVEAVHTTVKVVLEVPIQVVVAVLEVKKMVLEMVQAVQVVQVMLELCIGVNHG